MRIKHLSSSLVIILIMTFTSPCAFANFLVNGDFETGTAGGWSPVGPTLSGCGGAHTAIQYTLALGIPCVRPLPLVPPYDGQAFAGYARTGNGIEIGFEQTVSVTPGVSTFFSLDFAVREVQIPRQGRANQTVSLRLNGVTVASQFFAAPSTEFGHFEGTFTPLSSQVTFTMVSFRPLGFATGFGQVFFDNAVLTGLIIGANPIIGDGTTFEGGVVIGDNADIGSNVQFKQIVTVGDDVVLGDEVIVEHDVMLGDDVDVGFKVKIEEFVVIGNGVSIGDNSVIKKCAIINDNASIGTFVTIEIGAVIGVGEIIVDNAIFPAGATVCPPP